MDSLKQTLKASQRRKTAGPPGDLHRCVQADRVGLIWENKSLGKLSSPLQPVNDYVFTCPWGKSLCCGLSNPEGFPVSSGRSGSEVALKTLNALSVLHHLTNFRLELMFSIPRSNSREQPFLFITVVLKQSCCIFFLLCCKVWSAGATSLRSESPYRMTCQRLLLACVCMCLGQVKDNCLHW